MANYNKTSVQFDKNYLQQLTQNDNSGVEVCKTKHHLAIHPFQLNDSSASVKEILNTGIAKYNKNLGGILLGYQNVKLLNGAGVINGDDCYIHIDIEAEFFVFKPEVKQILLGVVNKISKDHVGCLVHKAFNVSIPKPEDDDDWLGTNVTIGQEVLLQITFTSFDSRLPYIRGSLISISSEQDSGFSTSEENSEKNLTKNCEGYDVKTKKRKNKGEENPKSKRRKILDMEENISKKKYIEVTDTMDETYTSKKQHKKKALKHKSTEQDAEAMETTTYSNLEDKSVSDVSSNHDITLKKKKKRQKLEETQNSFTGELMSFEDDKTMTKSFNKSNKSKSKNKKLQD